MYSTAINFVILLLFLHTATSKVYIVDLTDDETKNEGINVLQELLRLLKKPEESILNEDENQSDGEDDCTSLVTTKAQKLKCLENLKNKKSIGRDPFYPDYHTKYYAQRPKTTIVSLYNYYGGILKSKQPFRDLTRQEFSEDYLDIGELSRVNDNCYHQDCLASPSPDRDNKRKLAIEMADLVPNAVARRNVKSVGKRTHSSDESSDSSESDRNDRQERKHRKPNRFQVIYNGDSLESEEEREKKPKKSYTSESEYEKEEKRESNSESESEEVTQKPKKREKYSYLQGNKVYNDFRRRLQHFLPKRFHWDEDEVQNLGYYWFNGPKGRYT